MTEPIDNKIDIIIHDRIQMFYDLWGTLPNFVPVNKEEYHMAERKFANMTMKCHCDRDDLQKKYPIIYQIGSHPIEVKLNRELDFT